MLLILLPATGRYWLRHASLTWLELPIYALRRGHVRLAAQCLAAVLLYAGALAALYCVRPVAALWVFILPYFLSTLAMMFGNWCAAATLHAGTVSLILMDSICPVPNTTKRTGRNPVKTIPLTDVTVSRTQLQEATVHRMRSHSQ
jgi:hypothetical protein